MAKVLRAKAEVREPLASSRGALRDSSGILAPKPRMRHHLHQVPSPSRAAAFSAARATRVVAARVPSPSRAAALSAARATRYVAARCSYFGDLSLETDRQCQLTKGNTAEAAADVQPDAKLSPQPVWAVLDCMVKDKNSVTFCDLLAHPGNVRPIGRATSNSMDEPAPEPSRTVCTSRGYSQRRSQSKRRRERRTVVLASWARFVLKNDEQEALIYLAVRAELDCGHLNDSLIHETGMLNEDSIRQERDTEVFHTECELRPVEMQNEQVCVVREVLAQSMSSNTREVKSCKATPNAALTDNTIVAAPGHSFDLVLPAQRRLAAGAKLFAASAVPIVAHTALKHTPWWVVNSAAASGFALFTMNGQRRARAQCVSSSTRALLLKTVRVAQSLLAKLEQALSDDTSVQEPFAEPSPEMLDAASQVATTDPESQLISSKADYKRTLAAAAYTLWIAHRFRKASFLSSSKRSPAVVLRIYAAAYVAANSVERVGRSHASRGEALF